MGQIEEQVGRRNTLGRQKTQSRSLPYSRIGLRSLQKGCKGIAWGLCALALSSCATVGVPVEACGPNDKVIRYTPEQIELMTDQQVTDNLARNEELERRQCGVPNQ